MSPGCNQFRVRRILLKQLERQWFCEFCMEGKVVLLGFECDFSSHFKEYPVYSSRGLV